MQTSGRFTCAYCGERNETPLDPSGGLRQEYVEDCEVCCRPNLLVVTFSPDASEAVVVAEQENEW